jgi:arginine-tRNA-protein transferase
MFAQVAYPDKLLPEELDTYLANGWFRMRQTIFTTNFLHFDLQYFSAIWLRVALDEPIIDKKYKALKKLNKDFKIEIQKLSVEGITTAQELLYLHYRKSVAFDVSPSLQELLFGTETVNRFDTYQANIYDGERLIATGFFDIGQNSAAGITSIYHPEYKKYSLGKYLIYLKMEYCKLQHLQYFYPGYVVPGYAPFDYKLEVGRAALQYLKVATNEWFPVSEKSLIVNPMETMIERLSTLHSLLLKARIPNSLLYYRFFEANLHPYYQDLEFFDFPVFINCFPIEEASFYTVIVFDIRENSYQLVDCSAAINIGIQQQDTSIFDADLLKLNQVLFVSASPEEMVTYLSAALDEI